MWFFFVPGFLSEMRGGWAARIGGADLPVFLRGRGLCGLCGLLWIL